MMSASSRSSSDSWTMSCLCLYALLMRRRDLGARREHRLELAAEHRREVVHRVRVERRRGRDLHRPVAPPDARRGSSCARTGPGPCRRSPSAPTGPGCSPCRGARGSARSPSGGRARRAAPSSGSPGRSASPSRARRRAPSFSCSSVRTLFSRRYRTSGFSTVSSLISSASADGSGRRTGALAAAGGRGGGAGRRVGPLLEGVAPRLGLGREPQLVDAAELGRVEDARAGRAGRSSSRTRARSPSRDRPGSGHLRSCSPRSA